MMTLEEMIKVIDEARKSIDNEELQYKLANVGIFLAKLKDLIH